MGLVRYRLGELIELFSERCNKPDLSVYDISGINSDKEFFEPARQAGGDTSSYKIVPPGYFACNLMHVGRDAVLPIALNTTDKNKIVSPAYTVFRLTDNAPVVREYFFMIFKSSERDRYFWFHSDSSVRDGMPYEDFCDTVIDLPPVEIQRKYVRVYLAMKENQRVCERGLEDLKLVCDMYIDKLKHNRPKIEIGTFIQQTNFRNTDNKQYPFKGLSMENYFIDSIADDTGLDFSAYKIVYPDDFGCVLMKVGRDCRLTIAQNTSNIEYMISPAYYTFRLSGINPLYFMVCVSRREFERRAWFSCDTSARGSLSWQEFCRMVIPDAKDDEQKIIADLYKAYSMRHNVIERLKSLIKDICPVLIKGAIDDAQKSQQEAQ